MTMRKFLLGQTLVWASFWASAAGAEVPLLQARGQIYAESGCNFAYSTRGAFRFRLDARDLQRRLGQKIESVTMIWGFSSDWTTEFGLNEHPRSIAMRSTQDGAFELEIKDVTLARKGRFQLKSIDFLFHVQLENGEVADFGGPGYGEFFTSDIPYSSARCALGNDWTDLAIQVRRP
jgi:hypothetical protein